MTRPRLLRALVLPAVAAVALSITATGQTRQTASGVVLGQIVDATAGKPIGGAVVTLTFSPPPRPPLPPGTTMTQAEIAAQQALTAPRRIMTDGTGVFVFHSLPEGSYRMAAEAPGFLSGGFGQLRPSGPIRQIDIDEGERRAGITIKLWPYGSITGTIFDEFGEPAIGVSLRLLRITTSNGQRRLTTGQGAQTDDRGAYRFGQLAPGDYLVVVPQTVTSMPLSTIDAYNLALSRPNGSASVADMNRSLQESGAPSISSAGLRVGDQQFLTSGGSRPLAPPSVGEGGKTFAYHTMFYPSAAASGEATPVAVTSGQERTGIDMQLRPVQTVRVTGSLTGPDGMMPNMGVKLVPSNSEIFGSENGFETASTATDAAGTFTFPAVPTGSYTVRAMRVPRPVPPPPPPPPTPAAGGRATPTPVFRPPQPAPEEFLLWADAPVSVSDTDVSGLNVTLRPGARISGRVAFDGTTAQIPTPDQLQRITVSISTADGRPNLVGTQNRVGLGGTFTTIGYPPGRYVISAGAPLPGWSFKGATLGGRSIDEEPLDLQSSDLSGVTLTFTDKTTQFSGTVSDPNMARDMSATIFVFPANYPTWLERGTIGRRARSVTVGGRGAFSMSGLAAGNYMVAAVNPDTISDIRDRAFYDALARIATRFSLADGEKKTMDLSVSAIR